MDSGSPVAAGNDVIAASFSNHRQLDRRGQQQQLQPALPAQHADEEEEEESVVEMTFPEEANADTSLVNSAVILVDIGQVGGGPNSC